MKLFSFIVLCFAVFISVLLSSQIAVNAEQATVVVDFYYSETCPHCAKEKPLLNYIAQQNEQVTVNFIEVTEKPEVWQNYLQENNIKATGVPRTVIADRAFIGFTEEEGELEYNSAYQAYLGYKNQIINAIQDQLNTPLKIPEKKTIFFFPLVSFFISPDLWDELPFSEREII